MSTLGATGSYLTYLRATSNSEMITGNAGTFYAVEIAAPTFSGSSCSATLNIHKQINNTLTTPFHTAVACHDGMVVRAVIQGSTFIVVYIDNIWVAYWADTSNQIYSGQPGVGGSHPTAYFYITTIDIGHLDAVAPNPLNAQLIGTSSFPTRVDIQFPGDIDDPIGTGVAFYQLWRNGTYVAFSPTPEFSDTAVSPGTTYTYEIQAVDYHYNTASVYITVTTPPAGSIDPREVGVRPTGGYWGSAGEQLDMRSGNLNFTMPLVKVMGRGGWSANFSLSYNSQNWRQDPGGTWQLGRDIGYGYGLRLQAGSLTPVYDSYWQVDHYLFIDSTGAEYHLNVQNSGIWTSLESIYVTFDTTVSPPRLHFTDGGFWEFGSISAGTEQDAGTMYPTLMEDSNGNQTLLVYNDGVGTTWSNSSSRISTIEDVRGNGSPDYTFTYNSDTIPHLTGITNTIQTAEKYTFTYAENQPLNSPFAPATGYGNWTFLSTVANGVPLTTSFTYDSTGTGELDQVTFPYGGHIRWAYGPFTYSGSRVLREVNGGRFLSMSAGATELTYSMTFDPTANSPFHSYGLVDDPDGNSEKVYYFGVTSGQPSYSVFSETQTRLHHSNGYGMIDDTYTWTADSAGNPYITTDLTTQDYALSTQIQKQTTQTRDQYGNLLQMKVYNYGNLTTPARTYTNTYLTGSNYTPLYIFNRLLTSTVTDGTNSTTLATNVYDNATDSYCTGSYSLTSVSANEHDNTNYGTGFAYRGNPAANVTPSGTVCTTYDITGNVVTSNNNGLSTSVTTSNNFAVPASITTISLQSTATWQPFLGLSTAAGPNGNTTSVTYDANARPLTSVSTYGATTNYTYNDATAPHTIVATTNGHWVKTTLDGFGRTISTQTGNGTTTVSEVDTTYITAGCEPLGKMGKRSQPYVPGGTVYNTTYTYDGLSRTLTKVAPDGSSTTSYSYAGNTVTVTDPAAKTKTFTKDAFGNLTQVQEPDPALGTVSTTYTYDILNHLTSVSMPRGSNTQTRTFNYTSGTTVGINLYSATNPENGTVRYAYNSDNTLQTKTDAKGQLFAYTYDGYKRLTQIRLGGNLYRTFMYDGNSPDPTFSGSYTSGRLVAVQNAQFSAPGTGAVTALQFTEMYAYTQSGQISGKRLQSNQTVTGGTVETLNMDAHYTYDSEGKMTSVAYPTTYAWNGSALVGTAGPTYTYSFDAMDRATGLKDQNNNTAVSGVTYNAANQFLTINYFSANETRTYNSTNQMTRLSIPSSLDISYNFPGTTNNGQISSQTDNISGETVTYQYDSLKRLISASGSGWSETYGYDSFGNLTSKTPTGTAPTLSQAVNATTNQVVGQTYDANGNQLSGPLASVTYDPENRILTAPGVEYAYDSSNKRIWKGTISGGAMTAQEIYFYGVNSHKLATYAITANAGTTPYLANSATNLAIFFRRKRVGITTNGTTTAFVQNRLGSQGNYYPYGEARGTVPQDAVGFATYTQDSATALDYADQRYYANNFARFMTPDPYGGSRSPRNPTSWNRYSYVLGDPIDGNDPEGLDCTTSSGQTGASSGVDCGNAGGGDSDDGDGPITDAYVDPNTQTTWECDANSCWDTGLAVIATDTVTATADPQPTSIPGFTLGVTSTLVPSYFPAPITGPTLEGPAPQKTQSPPRPAWWECLITPNESLAMDYPATLGPVFGGPQDASATAGVGGFMTSKHRMLNPDYFKKQVDYGNPAGAPNMNAWSSTLSLISDFFTCNVNR
jgi:RHS repeat-associated protein